MAIDQKEIDRFRTLFEGRDTVYGLYEIDHDLSSRQTKVAGKAQTLKAPVTPDLYALHVTGNQGLGIVPICDDQKCRFAALDIDEYNLDLKALNTECLSLGLPFVLCRTKSGGAHLYVFFSEPVLADFVRKKLKEFAEAIGYPKVEIFPKQKKIGPDDVGNWINLPYFAAEGPTERYGYDKDNKVLKTLKDFCNYAEKRKVTRKDLSAINIAPKQRPFDDGPPCLQRLTQHGFPEGTRNEGLYQISVYARQKYPDEWKEKLHEINQECMDPPLPAAEVTQVANSQARKESFYKCESEPFASVCSREICLQRKYGIGPSNGNDGELERMLGTLQKLVPFDMDGNELDERPLWSITANGIPVELTTDQLFDQNRFLKRIIERVSYLPNRIPPREWLRILREKMDSVEVVRLPPESSFFGTICNALRDFIQEYGSAETRIEVDTGGVYEEDGYYYFKWGFFFNYLTTNRICKNEERQKVAAVVEDLGGERIKSWKIDSENNKVTAVWRVSSTWDKDAEAANKVPPPRNPKREY